MDGAGKLKQHDNVHKQITAFEKLLQHAMSRFSKEKLYQMLRILQRGIPDIPRVPAHRESKDTDDSVFDSDDSIFSLGQLKDIVSNFKNERRKGIQKEEEKHLVNYFETFFDDLRYMKDLKVHFDEKIYCCLYDYFYDPMDDINGAFDLDLTGQKALIILEDERDSGHSSMPGSDEDQRNNKTRRVTFNSPDDEKEPGVRLDRMSEKEKLSYAVRELYHVNQNWDRVLTEKELDSDWFEVDSHYELLEFTRYESFENVLRLVPDVFVKAFKSAELAKLWWTQANKIYPQVPHTSTRNAGRDFNSKVDMLERNIRELALDIAEDDRLFNIAKKDLKLLKDRENRYNVLSASCEKVEELMNETNAAYKDLYHVRDRVKLDLGNLTQGSAKYNSMEKKLYDYDHRLIQTNGKLKLLKYHFGILQGDFNLELEVRPNIIRFVADVQNRVRELEDTLIIKRQVKRHAEKQLVLLRTNCERMRKIMRKRVGTAEPEDRSSQKSKPERKRNRRRPTSDERRIAKERLQEEQQGKKDPLPDHLQPRRDATFVTSVASDQDSMDDKDHASRQYFDSLEVERVKIPPKAPSESRHRGRSPRDVRGSKYGERGRRQRSKQRSQSHGRGSESDSRYKGRRVYSDYDSDMSERRTRVDDSWIKPTPRRVSRKDRDRRRRSPEEQDYNYRHRTPPPERRDRRDRREQGRHRDR